MNKKKNDISSECGHTNDEFISFVGRTGLLCWRWENGSRQIDFINSAFISGLESRKNAEQLLLNLIYAQELVIPDDFFRFKLFIKSMRDGEAASVIFRIKDSTDNRFWLRIEGSPSRDNPSLYYGYIRDISEQVSVINFLLEKDLERHTMIEHDDIPVFLVDMEKKTIISRNTFAYELFGYSYHEFNQIEFKNLYPIDHSAQISKAYETCLLDGHWEGHLTFLKKGDIAFDARVKVKHLSLKDRNLLRISIHDVFDSIPITRQNPESDSIIKEETPDEKEIFKNKLITAVGDKQDMYKILETLLAYKIDGIHCDALIYADVQHKKRKVDVYAFGESFNNLKSGTSFNYEGTVSQYIQENRLDIFFMDDTFQSLRPIDWALFIPHGIRSYLAKPFFHGDKLRSILVFCSTQANVYSEKELDLYALYYPAFLHGLRNTRKKKK